MKFIGKCLWIIFICAISQDILAELRLVETHIVAAGGHRDTKLIINRNEYYWVTASPLGEQPSFQLNDFFSSGPVGNVLVDINHAPIFMPQGHQTDIIVTGNWRGDWSAVRLSRQSKRVKKYVELPAILLITESAAVASKYAIGGMSKDYMPALITLGNNLEIQHESIWRSKIKAQVSSVFFIADKLYVVVSYFDVSSELWELSNNLSIVRKIRFPGGAATGIPLVDGGIAVAYSAGQDTFDVIVERINANMNSIWRKKIMTRTGVDTPRFVLCELADGLGVVGANNDHLVVARIGADGKKFHLTEDGFSGLSSPASQGYSVAVLQNIIHVRGLTVNSDGSWTSFHFVESATP